MSYQFEPIAEENLFQDFCRDLFNHLYDTRSFQLYKTKGASQNGIDIVSSSLQIVIQAKKKKLTRTDVVLEKELLNDLAESIRLTESLNLNFDKFYMLTTTKKYGKVQDYAIELSQSYSFEVIFWAWEDIEEHITQFAELRKKYYSHLWSENALPKILTYVPNIDQRAIIGRENDLIRIENLLASSNKVVLVNGVGGIGKSTLAKLYLGEHFNSFTHILWIDVQNSGSELQLKSSFLEAFSNDESLLSNLRLSFRPETTLDEKFQIITNKLQNISGSNLLVIDNATVDIVNYDFRLPGSSNWKILLTSRSKIDNYATLNLDVLNDNDAIALFYLHYNYDSDDRVISIIQRIGSHTLTIELLAKIANKRKLKIEELIVALKKEGLKLSISAKVISGHQKIKNPVYLFDYLLSIFSIAELDETSIALLRWFSVLPVQNIIYDDLKLIFQVGLNDNAFFETLSDITNGGWLNSDGSSYQMHQVVGEILREKLTPSCENCENIIKGLIQLIHFKSGENFLSKLRYLPIIESVISHIQDESDDFILLLNNLAAMHDYNGNSIAAIRYYENILEILGTEVTDANNHVFINLAVSNLRIGNYQNALEYNKENIKFLEHQQDMANTLMLAMSYNNLGENYRFIGDFEKSLKFNLKALKILESNPDWSKHVDLATVYNNLSNYYSSVGDRRSSLKFGLKAMNIREVSLDKDHPLLAQSYNNIGVDYEKLNQLHKSKEYHLKAIEIRKKIYEEEHYDLAESYNNFAQLLNAKLDHDQAIIYHKKSISIRESTLPPDHPEIAMAYGNIAGSYFAKNDITKAKDYFEKAIAIRLNSESPIHPELGLFYFNYAVLLFSQNNYAAAKQKLDHCISIFSKTIPISHPNYRTANQFQAALNLSLLKKTQVSLAISVPSRNDACHCGSGKKYKHCCLNK